ncbi:hypothetical protein PIGHUM_00185 [Pigmentiphaga humi]|uniref:Iron uptake protein n=1 Tax=Pigmentiphaga humi TaxID=2478468 RepID=A0A3P4AZ82_9BURK|nr:DUF3325 family protein [Pigmentiphaga humi]VCU68135.1 hypothetical protein PIGHUM_00185 [Pigmentiphaga humi]
MKLFALAALLYAAVSLLAMASERYRHDMAGGRPASPWLRAAGWALLALAALPAVWGWGPSIGVSLWLGAIGLAAFCCTLLISFRPRWVPWAGLAGLLLGLPGLALA